MGERVNGGVGLKNTAVESRQGQRLEPPVAARAIWGEHDQRCGLLSYASQQGRQYREVQQCQGVVSVGRSPT